MISDGPPFANELTAFRSLLQIDVRELPQGLPIIDLTGQIDMYTAPQFKTTLLSLIEQRYPHVLVNFSAVTYVDSSGLGVLFGGYRRMERKNGSIIILSPCFPIQRIFSITQLDQVFKIYPTEQQALEAILTQ